jgi:hypothetical protein
MFIDARWENWSNFIESCATRSLPLEKLVNRLGRGNLEDFETRKARAQPSIFKHRQGRYKAPLAANHAKSFVA